MILSFTFFLNFEVLCFRFRFSFFFFFEFFCELWIAEADAVRAYLYSSSYTPSSIPPISILFPLSSTFYIFLSIIYLLSSVYPLSISSIVCRLFLISSF